LIFTIENETKFFLSTLQYKQKKINFGLKF